MTATATRTSWQLRFTKQNINPVCSSSFLLHFFTHPCTTTTWTDFTSYAERKTWKRPWEFDYWRIRQQLTNLGSWKNRNEVCGWLLKVVGKALWVSEFKTDCCAWFCFHYFMFPLYIFGKIVSFFYFKNSRGAQSPLPAPTPATGLNLLTRSVSNDKKDWSSNCAQHTLIVSYFIYSPRTAFLFQSDLYEENTTVSVLLFPWLLKPHKISWRRDCVQKWKKKMLTTHWQMRLRNVSSTSLGPDLQILNASMSTK